MSNGEARSSRIIPYGDHSPRVHDTVFIAPGAWVIGEVEVGELSSIWFNAVVRGDVNWITIGAKTNIQDGSVLHVRHETGPLVVGDQVTCGHSVTLHACTVGERCLIGIGATVLDGAVMEPESMVAAAALVPPGMVVPSGTIVAGVPARVMRNLTREERSDLAASADRYVGYANKMRSGL